ncbi:MAG: leucine--tRNA ligase [Flavobacteriales bacterium]
MDYHFQEIERKWQEFWEEHSTYKTENQSSKPKYYVLDMFPYPSGAGLHVGHPLGYIASDIVSRFKRLKGFNVLHPMGFDAFGLPAEQYAIQTGQHPAKSTDENLKRYRKQLDKLGFSFDWSREVRTCDPKFYKWTQWIFLQLFGSWYNEASQKAEPISQLIAHFETEGTSNLKASSSLEEDFDAESWKSFSESEKEAVLQHFRLAFRSMDTVNWCPELGTVLANDEVKNGKSERGNHPVEQRKMWGWRLRISAYADRLLKGLETIDWTEALKEQQRHWIGKSKGAQVLFQIENHDQHIEVFTTRPDTIYGVNFLTLAPENELIDLIVTSDYKQDVADYVAEAKNRSERDRQANVKHVSGVFTGAYAVHPFSQKKIPIWVGDYVLGSYGTGAVMAVPAHDSRDFAFANHFRIPITQVISANGEANDILEEAYEEKAGVLVQSGDFDGMKINKASSLIVEQLKAKKQGKWQTNFRLRDAVFSRQRYWGEPIPIYFENDIPKAIETSDLPLLLADVDEYKPTAEGLAPLARNPEWKVGEHPIEPNTMPGWAGSSWYFLRYMDPTNESTFASKEAMDYWQQVDLYLGGSEHATGHLLYARFWTKFMFDLGLIPIDEPFKKLFNQGMILGRSSLAHRIEGTNTFVSADCVGDHKTNKIHVDVAMVENDCLDIEQFKLWRDDLNEAEFILNAESNFLCEAEVEKMSKSKYNVVNPDDIVERYGADTLRLYEMFLGPLDQSKPWNTQGISGVYSFLKKFWRLAHPNTDFEVSEEKATREELAILHKTIHKIESDIEQLALNTSVSTFMITVNELTKLKCNKREILEPLCVLLASFAPYITEELWSKLGHQSSVHQASFPEYNAEYTKATSVRYPVSFNGKVRYFLELDADLSKEDIEKQALSHQKAEQYLNGNPPKRVIVVPNKIVNVVI